MWVGGQDSRVEQEKKDYNISYLSELARAQSEGFRYHDAFATTRVQTSPFRLSYNDPTTIALASINSIRT
jgi:hypothetical protein